MVRIQIIAEGETDKIVRGRGGPERGGYLANTDLLIVHIDGEVAEDPEVACAKPCPPPADTADALEKTVMSCHGWDAMVVASFLQSP